MSAGRLIAGVFASLLATSAFAAGQRIDADTSHWIVYTVDIGEVTVSLSVPPNHRFKDQPTHLVRKLDSREPFRNLAFSAQYDYGWLRWDNIAQFEVTYTTVSLTKALAADVPLAEFRQELSRAVERADRRPSGARDWAIEEVAGSAAMRWMRSFDPADEFRETFAALCSPDLAIIVSPLYWGDELAKNIEWKRKRRALVRPMLEKIHCQEAT